MGFSRGHFAFALFKAQAWVGWYCWQRWIADAAFGGDPDLSASVEVDYVAMSADALVELNQYPIENEWWVSPLPAMLDLETGRTGIIRKAIR